MFKRIHGFIWALQGCCCCCCFYINVGSCVILLLQLIEAVSCHVALASPWTHHNIKMASNSWPYCGEVTPSENTQTHLKPKILSLDNVSSKRELIQWHLQRFPTGRKSNPQEVPSRCWCQVSLSQSECPLLSPVVLLCYWPGTARPNLAAPYLILPWLSHTKTVSWLALQSARRKSTEAQKQG